MMFHKKQTGITFTSCNFCISTAIPNLEMTICMVYNRYLADTIPMTRICGWSDDLEVPTITSGQSSSYSPCSLLHKTTVRRNNSSSGDVGRNPHTWKFNNAFELVNPRIRDIEFTYHWDPMRKPNFRAPPPRLTEKVSTPKP